MAQTFEKALKARIDGKAKPFGALGRIERLAYQVARLQQRLDPVMEAGRLDVYAADHGIAAENVSAYPDGEPKRMMARMAGGGAAAHLFAAQSALSLQVIDCGVLGGPFEMPGIANYRVGDGTASFLVEPAMTDAQLELAFEYGDKIGRMGDVQALGFGEMARGSSSAATLIVHKLTGTPLQGLIGRGAGLDEEGLFHKHDILSAARTRVDRVLSPQDVLREYGGFEIAMMASAMISAAEAKRIVLVDGYVSGAAALLAAQIAPQTRAAMVFSHLSKEPGHQVILDAMGAKPLLWLDMVSGEGAGVALAWPIVRAAVDMLENMAERDPA